MLQIVVTLPTFCGEAFALCDIVYRFLVAIGIDEATAAIDAEGIEHHVSPTTLERFRELADQSSHTGDKIE